MADVRVLLAFAALVALALVYVSFGVRAALAPFCAVGTVALWLGLFGALGVLAPVTWALYLLAAAGVVLVVVRHVVQKKPLVVQGFGFWFFVAGGLVCIALLWAKQPMFTEWDEFSLWGTAGKLMKLNDELYTTAPVGWGWATTQTPALMVQSYFVQFFGAGFAEWQSILGVDLFQLAAMAAILAPFEGRHWPFALPVVLATVLAPYVFTRYMYFSAVSTVYLNTLVDVPMGLAFGAVLVCGLYGGRRLAGMVPACIGLATLTLLKEIGMALALVAAVVLAADYLLAWEAGAARTLPARRGAVGLLQSGGTPGKGYVVFSRAGDAPAPLKPAAGRRVLGALLRLGMGVAAVMLPFMLWRQYTAGLAGAESATTLGGKENISMLQMPLRFLADLFASEKSELFRHVTNGMWNEFLSSKISMLGSGAVIVCICLGLVLFAAGITRSRPWRRRCLWFGLLSLLGFVAYYMLVTMSYLYLFRVEQAMIFDSYNRYVYPYYIGWFLAALCLAGGACTGLDVQKTPRRAAVGGLALLLVGVVLFARVGQVIPAVYTLAGVHPSVYDERRAFAEKTGQLQQQLNPDGKTFLVISNDVGNQFFLYCYQLLPWQVDYSFGGGEILQKESQPDGTETKRVLRADELAAHLLETGCTTLYIDNADELFVTRYAGLFADGLENYQRGYTRLYDVTPQDDGVLLTPRILEE